MSAATPTKCSKCQKETKKDKECPCEEMQAKDAKQQVKMEFETDLTTTETIDDMDELEEKSMNERNKTEKPQQQQQKSKQEKDKDKKQEEHQTTEPVKVTPAKTKTKAETEAAVATEATPVPQRAGGKVTRSSLNGARSPTIIKRLRKSTRSTRFKSKVTGRGSAGDAAAGGQSGNAGLSGSAAAASSAGKGHGKGGGSGGGAGAGARNRRTLFKRPAQKTPRVQACTRFVKSVFYKGSYMQIGDIVSIVDSEQNLYYAQIRGLLVDAYCEKSAFLSWLIPTQDSPDPKDGFDPATYLIGPDEELSRKLCYLEFVMHAPSNYYYDRSTPFPLPDVDEYTEQRNGGFIWTRLPVIKRERELEREREREKEKERDRERKAAA